MPKKGGDLTMTNQTKQLILDAKTIEEKIKVVNKVLQDGEPGNISNDTYSGFTGYKPQFIVDAMNIVFHIGNWGFEEVFTEIVSHQTEKGTSSLLAICQVKVWIKEVEFQPVSWGQSRVTKGDLGDAKKGAQTDAIKKGLSYFSIGNRAYHGLLKAA
jgi:Rad52/22 family double-strand break repair protein